MSVPEEHLDMDAIAELREIMEDEFNVLLETFLSDSVVKMGLIDAAIVNEDCLALREAAHSLKGSSSNIGAPHLSTHCADIEKYAREQALADAIAVLPTLRMEYQAVRTALEAALIP